MVANHPHVQGFFDGGAANKIGTGGFVVFDRSGECLVAQAKYYGEELGTNNRAEVYALKDMMEYWKQSNGLEATSHSDLRRFPAHHQLL